MPPAPVKSTAKKVAPASKKAVGKKPASSAPALMRKTGGPPPSKPPQIVPIGTGSEEYPRLLIYGEPGTYKTSLLGTAHNGLMLEADQGDVSAKRQGSTNEKWFLADWDEASEALSWLMMGGYKHYDFLSLDTVSMFQFSGLQQIMEDLVEEKQHRKVWQPDKGEYGQNMARLLRYVRDLVRIPIPIAVTAHIQQETDHEGESRYMPQVQGRDMPAKVCAYFDIIGHMSIRAKGGEERPVFSTRKEGKYYTKDRYGVIGIMSNPTIPKILAKIAESPQGATPIKAAAKKVSAAKKAAPRG